MPSIPIENNLCAPHLGKDSPVEKLIAARAKQHHPQTINYATLWSADWWGFPDCDDSALGELNRGLIREAYFIEKSGLAYCAKMTLLAETTDVAQLYALIGADEAKHLAWIEPYMVPSEKTQPESPFLNFLSLQIEDLPPRLLVLLVQIVLEGWGLDHYRRLATGCHDAQLARVFNDILRDEALHHRSGTILFDASSLTPEDLHTIENAFRTYTDMVRTDPRPAEQARKLTLLKTLMSQPGLETVIERLTQAGCFAPPFAGATAPTTAAHASNP